VVALCRARWDLRALERLPFPLVERLVVPELRRGYAGKLPAYARWLGLVLGSSDLGGGRTRDELLEAGLSADGLLREALAADPNDAKARAALIRLYDGDFDYYLHDLPAGVLTDAASFARDLDHFEQLVAAHGVAERYATRLRRWRFHSQAWGDYLRRRAQFSSYADYLSEVHPDRPEALRALLPWLRHSRQWRRVRAAASALLRQVPATSPERWHWLTYRAEAALALGDRVAAQADITELARSPQAVWQRRARQLATTYQHGTP